MIYPEDANKVYSNLINEQIFSEEDSDYRVSEQKLRMLEQEGARNLENNEENKRLLE